MKKLNALSSKLTLQSTPALVSFLLIVILGLYIQFVQPSRLESHYRNELLEYLALAEKEESSSLEQIAHMSLLQQRIKQMELSDDEALWRLTQIKLSYRASEDQSESERSQASAIKREAIANLVELASGDSEHSEAASIHLAREQLRSPNLPKSFLERNLELLLKVKGSDEVQHLRFQLLSAASFAFLQEWKAPQDSSEAFSTHLANAGLDSIQDAILGYIQAARLGNDSFPNDLQDLASIDVLELAKSGESTWYGLILGAIRAGDADRTLQMATAFLTDPQNSELKKQLLRRFISRSIALMAVQEIPKNNGRWVNNFPSLVELSLKYTGASTELNYLLWETTNSDEQFASSLIESLRLCDSELIRDTAILLTSIVNDRMNSQLLANTDATQWCMLIGIEQLQTDATFANSWLTLAERRLSEKPSDINASLLAARSFIRLGKIERAVSHLEEASTIHPNNRFIEDLLENLLRNIDEEKQR